VSIAAQLGVTPVLLAVFGTVPLLSPIANLLASPAAEALGVFGFAAAVVGGVVPPVAVTVAPLLNVLLTWVTVVAHIAAGSGGSIGTRPAVFACAMVAIATVARRARRAHALRTDTAAR
jgi:hypothetical protein